MRQAVSLCLVALLVIPNFPGCSIWRQASQPELWGLSLPETWSYGELRNSGKTHFEARRIIRQSRSGDKDLEAITPFNPPVVPSRPNH
ncbi:hypothetical protein OAG68_02270 [bacterium]|nr:hypothetical protein [bacterium]